MLNVHNDLLEQFLASVPGDRFDDADRFVREVRFMCNEYIVSCPIPMYRSVPHDKQSLSFFRTKNRHRPVNEAGSILNNALQNQRAYERGLDISAQRPAAGACAIFLPDAFTVAHSLTPLSTFVEGAALVDEAELARLAYSNDVRALSERSQHILANNVPFYYCIRINF